MSKILVIFGSKSDSEVYNKIVKILKDYRIDFDFKIASAHKNPAEVESIIQKNYSLIIAGAGLSAALPGFIASKTIRPIIGVPCEGNYQGLDALLSIVQMPRGIPVMGVGVNQAEIAALNAIKMLKEYDVVSIIGNKNEKAVRDTVDVFSRMNIPYKYATEPSETSVNLEFVYFDEPIEKKDQLVIYCPLLLRHDDKAEAALNLLKHSNHGLWVGLNNGVNAAVAAVEILNIENKYEQSLINYREELAK
jgi:5-(carboxyamino)imidazole ribonucleotide mutase